MFDTFTDSICAKTGSKLFDNQARKAAESCLETIRIGCVSDPVNIPLYYKMKEGAAGLPVYRCVRGANSVEGGVHMNVIRNFSSFNANPELTTD